MTTESTSDDRHRERLARLRLGCLAEPGDPKMAGLVEELGAVRLHDLLVEERDVQGILTDIAGRLAAVEPERQLERAARAGYRFVIPSDEEWPRGLADLAAAGTVQERGGAPLGLWVRGPLRLDALDRGSVAIVGSRSSTTYGVDTALQIGAEVAKAGLTVVSGAAYGIDQAAHRGALAVDAGTVAVLACGVDRIYPAAHRELLDCIAQTGAVVSEGPLGCAPTKVRFLSRNRLIAAATAATVVVEAAVRSGALNTANWADRLSRGLLGVPGPVTSAQSQGVHHLIRTGGATLVTCGADVLELVGRPGVHLLTEPRGEVRPRDRLTQRQARVLDAVPVAHAAAAGSIARVAGLGLAEVDRTLADLAAAGFVEWMEDGWVLGAHGRP